MLKVEDLEIGKVYQDTRDGEVCTLLDIGKEYVVVNWMGTTAMPLAEFLETHIPSLTVEISDYTNTLLELHKKQQQTVPIIDVVQALNKMMGNNLGKAFGFEEHTPND